MSGTGRFTKGEEFLLFLTDVALGACDRLHDTTVCLVGSCVTNGPSSIRAGQWLE